MNCERQCFYISRVYSFWQDLSHHTMILDLVTLTLKFDHLLKTLTFVISYEPWETGLSYFTCVFLVTRPFTSYHNFLPWPWSLTYFWKTLTVIITYEPCETGLSYFICVFLGTGLFTSYHYFWPSYFDLELWITYTKCCYSYLVASRRTSLFSDNSCSFCVTEKRRSYLNMFIMSHYLHLWRLGIKSLS